MRPFPRRTILLMVLALLAFARLYWVTHRPAPGAPAELEVTLVASPDSGATR